MNATTLQSLVLITIVTVTAVVTTPSHAGRPSYPSGIVPVAHFAPGAHTPELSTELATTREGVPWTTQRVERHKDTWFLVQQRSKDGCLTESIELVAWRDLLLAVPGMSVSNTCKGVNCQLCEFEPGVGCSCANPGNDDGLADCNHTLTIPDQVDAFAYLLQDPEPR